MASSGGGNRPASGAGVGPLLAYFGFLLLLLIAFVVIGAYAISQPVPNPL